MEGVDKKALEALIQKNVGTKIRKLRKAKKLLFIPALLMALPKFMVIGLQ